MDDFEKTKEELIKELEEMRQLVASLKSSPYGIYREKQIDGNDELSHDSHEHDELLKLVLTLSTNFIILSPEDIDEGINDVLKVIGDFAKVDRSYVFQFSEDGKTISNTHEWCAGGIKSQKVSLQGIPITNMSWFCSKIKNLEIVYISDIDEIPIEAKEERRFFISKQIVSLVAVPIVSGYTIIGFLGFECLRQKRVWSEKIISLLKIIGEIFANAIVRKRMAAALAESESRYKNIFENTVEGIFQITCDGGILSANPSFAAMFGYDSSDDMIREIKDVEKQLFIDPSEFLRFKNILEEKGFIKGFEIQGRHRDGYAFWISINARVVRNETNEILFFEGTLENIHEKKKMEEMLIQEREIFSSILHNAPYGIILSDKEGNFLYLNPEFVHITGYTIEDVPKGREWFRKAFPEPSKRKEAIRAWKENIGKKNIERFYKIVCKNNITKEIEFRVTTTGTDETITMLSDVTEKRQAEDLFKTLTEQSPVGIYLIQDGIFRYVNKVFADIHGYMTHEIIDRLSPKDLTVDLEGKKIEEVVRKAWGYKDSVRLDILVLRKDGTVRNGEIYGSKVIYNGKPAVLGTLFDVTEKKQMEERLKTLSVTDELTGLFNRRGFFTMAEQQFKISKRLGKKTILYFADMDGLKWINDNLGHDEGDKALIAFAGILKSTFRESDIIGRLGGDEFAVLALSTGTTDPDPLVRRLNHYINNYNTRESVFYNLSVSVGFAEDDPANHHSLEELVSIADDRMYSEKKKKKERALHLIKTSMEKVMDHTPTG
ncbi:MAG TPA: PAS domain S-box protein [Syntrophorhabdaceae bacterium]|nr:PAS domain S-box protein [Syntrophorhabdaceae bacterium]